MIERAELRVEVTTHIYNGGVAPPECTLIYGLPEPLWRVKLPIGIGRPLSTLLTSTEPSTAVQVAQLRHALDLYLPPESGQTLREPAPELLKFLQQAVLSGEDTGTGA